MAGNVETRKQHRQSLAVCSILLFVTLALYWPTFHFDFVNYDDGEYIQGNTAIQHGLNWPTVLWAFKSGYASNWHPLTWISHSLDCQFYGLKAGGHHLTNVLIHAANAILLFQAFRIMTSALWRSAFVAALFAWHPVHVESVAWVSERKDVLSTFFWMLTLLAYARYVTEFKVQSPKSKVWYGVALVCFALGLLSKPMLVTLPFVLLLVDYWPLGRIMDLGKSEGNSWSWKRISWLALEKIPFFALAIVSSVVTFLVQRKGGAVSSSISLGARIANALVSYLRYTEKVLWPHNLSVLYPHPGSWPVGWIAGAAAFLIAVSICVVLLGRNRPYLPVGWFWFLGTLVPVIGLVQVGVQSMADRYTYVPAIGLFVMAAWGAAELLSVIPRRNELLGAGGVVILVACLLIAHKQISYWQNGETLFRHVVQVTENNYLAYNNLGFYLENHNQPEEAQTDYEKSLTINPNYEDAQNNLGHILAAKGRYAEAVVHYNIALRIKPSLVEAHNNLGNALSSLGKLDEAIAEYQTALRYKPDDEDAYNNLGIARAMQGKFEEAVQLLSKAVELKPTDAGAQSNLGNALAAQHKLDEAIEHYQIALRLKPGDSQSLNNLANVLTEKGRYDEARENYLAALKINPKNPEANYNLGLLLLRQGKADEAISHFKEAVRLNPDYAEAKRQLELLQQKN